MPRALAADVLEDILFRRKSFDDAFSARTIHRARTSVLASRDRSFSYNLVATTLRRLGQIDDLIDNCLETPLPGKARGALTILRLGAAQLLFMNVSDHAAVNTSVDLAQLRRQGVYKKLINAILRRLGREGSKMILAQDESRRNTPAWLWDNWCKAYGEDLTRRIASAHLIPPPLDITVKSNLEEVAEALGGTLLPTGSVRLQDRPSVEILPGFDQGDWWVQDTAATLPVKLFPHLKGKRIIDLCAAPGGKTAQMAAAGAYVTAIDRSEKRIRLLQENMVRLSLDVSCIVEDAVQWRPREACDGVLIDAPCSATGTLRRHPDVQWIKSPNDVLGVAKIQRALLEASVGMVRPGGTIIFATCSLQPEEGPILIEDFLNSCNNVRRDPLDNDTRFFIPDMITADGDLRTFPHFLADYGGMDGFFAARLIRTS